MRGCLFRFAAILGSVALCLALMEAVLRVHDALIGASQNARTSWYWMYEQDPFLGYRGRPHARRRTAHEVVVHNADGDRDDRDLRELPPIGSGRRLVVCVGESSTYGLSARDNAGTYPALLEKELRRISGDERWTVYNAGMPGYTSFEILALVNLRLLKLAPEAIVTMNLRNDLEFHARTLSDDQDYDLYPLRVAPLSRTLLNDTLMRSSFYGFLAGRLRGSWVDDLGGRPPLPRGDGITARGRKLYLDDLASTALLCRRSGVRLQCVDQPVDVSGYAPEKRRSLAAMREDLARFCREGGVDRLEADAVFDWKGLTPEDDVHVGTEGYRRLAALLAPQIIESLARPERGGDLAAPANSRPAPDAGSRSPDAGDPSE